MTARWIGKRGKSSAQRSRRIFNHLVKYLAQSFERAKHFFLIVGESRRTDLPGSARSEPTTLAQSGSKHKQRLRIRISV
jgi:hypothetical protein